MNSDFKNHHEEDIEFAASGRVPFSQIERELEELRSNPPFITLIETVDEPLMVFNASRQLVYANQIALTMTGHGSLQNILALRLGEILQCDHTIGKPAGCGGDETCDHCNSRKSISAALEGRESGSHVKLEVQPDSSDVACSCSFRIQATPLPVDPQRRFALVSLSPLNAETTA